MRRTTTANTSYVHQAQVQVHFDLLARLSALESDHSEIVCCICRHKACDIRKWSTMIDQLLPLRFSTTLTL